ncbi:hypothetical protein ACFE04_007039 [Oxalis oulophora]
MMFGYSFLNTDFTLVEDEDVEDLTNDKPKVDKSKRRITLSAAAKRVTDTSSLPLPSSPSHGLLFRRHRYNRRCSTCYLIASIDYAAELNDLMIIRLKLKGDPSNLHNNPYHHQPNSNSFLIISSQNSTTVDPPPCRATKRHSANYSGGGGGG